MLVRRVQDFSSVPFLLSWVLPYSAFVYLLGTPGYTRYMLPTPSARTDYCWWLQRFMQFVFFVPHG